ncbi:MAG TPA: phosphatidylserine decarboxylase [Rhizomicrobium sp.]|nr:phosphatidylserine decarboxylase [Rhizomicrobium sp.]
MADLALHAACVGRALTCPFLSPAAEQGGGDGHAGHNLSGGIHRTGWPFIAIAGLVNVAGFALAGWPGWCLLPITLWVTAFFRDPARTPPAGDNLVIAPADGRLLPIVMAPPPPELGLGPEPRLRLSIFMTIFNVHVNRIPCDGMVTALAYRPGKFFNASFDKASVHNERMSIRVQAGTGSKETRELVVVQIAGLVARRIQCDLQEGQSVCRGDRFGIIRFGSRLEVFLPPGSRVVAHEGQSVRAGETVLAEFPC